MTTAGGDAAVAFVHLHVHTPFSFLDGASGVDELAHRAAELGMPALAVTDHDSLCATLRFATACERAGISPIFGVELTVVDEASPSGCGEALPPPDGDPCHLTLLARSPAGYANLCRLVTLAHRHGGRLSPAAPLSILPDHAEGVVCLTGCLRRGPLARLVRQHRYGEAEAMARHLLDVFGTDDLFVELEDDLTPRAQSVAQDLADLARRVGGRCVATNNVHHADRGGYAAHDLLSCVRAGVTATEPHPERPLNAERHLKSAADMAALFSWHPEAVQNTVLVAERCLAGLPHLPFGEDITPRHDAADSHAELRASAFAGARERYGAARFTPQVAARLEHELELICRLGYADYLLLVRDIMAWARGQGIRCSGRGSAADSAVCYALRITDVDVILRGLPFERFLMDGKVPDVDADFPHHRRDEVFRHIQERYGEDRVGMSCTFFTYHARSAVRDLGKALPLPEEALDFFSRQLRHYPLGAEDIAAAFERRSELKHYAHLRERFQTLFSLCARIADFPRHIGTHSSAVVISRRPLTDIAPLVPSATGLLPIWTLDKDDSEEAGGVKYDVLSLRILSSVADAVEDVLREEDPAFDYDQIPVDDPATYAMLQAGRAIGTFQLESAAQLSLATRLQPEEFEHVVHSVGLVRPANSRSGGDRLNTVGRYIAARHGFRVPDPDLDPLLDPILSKTYGVVLFQEQVDLLVACLTGISNAEAERFRKRLGKHEKKGTLHEARAEFVGRVLARRPELGERGAAEAWSQIEGWGALGFTEAHAASFARLSVATAYLSVHHPAAFFAGLMNWQPMGSWSPNTLASEARRRGVAVLPVDVNASEDGCESVDGGTAIRLGLRLLRGLSEGERAAILASRTADVPFASLLDFCARVTPEIRRDRLEELILAGTFDSLHGAERRRGLILQLDDTLGLARELRVQQVQGGQRALRLTARAAEVTTPYVEGIAEFSSWRRLAWEWRLTGVCAQVHPFALLRPRLAARGVLSVAEVRECEEGERITVAGLNLRPHRPPTKSGQTVLFSELEDETSHPLQVVCLGEALDRCTATLLLSPAVLAEGTVERRRGVALQIESVRPLRLPV